MFYPAVSLLTAVPTSEATQVIMNSACHSLLITNFRMWLDLDGEVDFDRLRRGCERLIYFLSCVPRQFSLVSAVNWYDIPSRYCRALDLDEQSLTHGEYERSDSSPIVRACLRQVEGSRWSCVLSVVMLCCVCCPSKSFSHIIFLLLRVLSHSLSSTQRPPVSRRLPRLWL